MLLVIVRVPADPGAVVRAAALLGLPPADVRRRIAGTLPRVLLVEADTRKVSAMERTLGDLGFVSLAVDPKSAPTDHDRIVARRLEPCEDGFIAVEGVGVETRHRVPAAAVVLVQRGVRLAVTSAEVKEVRRKLALGRAVLTGGLMPTKKVAQTSTQTTETHEPFAVVQRSDEGRDVMLYERRLDYRFLGREMQPSSFGNLQQTVAWVRRLAPGAAFDDRAARPGFLGGIPAVGGDPVDVALHVIRLARSVETTRGPSPRCGPR